MSNRQWIKLNDCRVRVPDGDDMCLVARCLGALYEPPLLDWWEEDEADCVVAASVHVGG